MQIYSIPNHSISYNKTTLKNNRVNFQGSSKMPLKKINFQQKKEKLSRIIGNKILDLFQSKFGKNFIKAVANIKPQRNFEYLEKLLEISSFNCTEKVFDINSEDHIIDDIATDGKSSIFIMNHSNQFEDPQMVVLLNLLLNESYLINKVKNFPLPKIIVNDDILKTMNPTKRKAFENYGAIGIDANLFDADKKANARAFLPIVKGFLKNECNIFIFPEGRLSVYKNLEFFDRFMPGTVNLVDKILNLKNEVRVVPVGFAYGKNEKKDLVGINIGNPLIIKRNNDITSITKGNVLQDKNSDLYEFVNKHKNEEDIIITKNGEPVSKDKIVGYLKTFLSENLEINSKLAQKRVDNSNPKEIIQEI